MLEEKRREAKAQAERRSKAEWAISICNQKVEDLEAQISKEKAQQNRLEEELEVVRQRVSETTGDIHHIESELKAVKELEGELRTRLEEFDLENSWFETQLAKAMTEKSEMERRAEALRRKRDAIRQQIEQCKLRELSKLWHKPYRDFTTDEIRDATGGFSGDFQIGAGERSTVYRAKICHIDVAVKFSVEFSTATAEKFRAEVDLLSWIRHPNILHVIGACEEQRCVVFEFAPGGSVRDALPILRWHERIRIASEVASALSFLHASGSAHGRLCATRVLLDRHLSVKLIGLLPCSSSPPPLAADVAALGELVLQLLAGRESISAEEDSMGLADPAAGDWPADLAAEFADVGVRCAAGAGEGYERTAEIARVLEDLKKRAEDEMSRREREGEEEMLLEPSSACFCPILQEIMENPHVAADGFSYEHDAIKGWLESGHETSPMTNLKLKHTNLTPNYALRSLISSWK
ncbi:putative U-box domain-containing protein 50 [Zingiber officinale]|uniref:putative U-box domain-containing protein 50 n=1 Tax=Zingiber officinale TaxID=94328 RepID=UPI001C4B1451|nr:putative U-box domain-containing protein 50 [Zingiber officinale]